MRPLPRTGGCQRRAPHLDSPPPGTAPAARPPSSPQSCSPSAGPSPRPRTPSPGPISPGRPASPLRSRAASTLGQASQSKRPPSERGRPAMCPRPQAPPPPPPPSCLFTAWACGYCPAPVARTQPRARRRARLLPAPGASLWHQSPPQTPPPAASPRPVSVTECSRGRLPQPPLPGARDKGSSSRCRRK